MANDTYTANADGTCYAGMFINQPIVGIASGGTVANLAADVTASGFTLLTTAPAGGSVYRNSGHAGMAWDEARQAMWIFGAETHSIAAQYDNSVYAFDLKDGVFKKQYEPSPWTGEYNISADGFLYADDAETLPWAVHTYQRFYYNTESKEFLVPIDMNFHAYTTPIQKGDVALIDRKKPILRYNTNTKVWSYDWSESIQAFLNTCSNIVGVAYSKTWGWVGSENSNLLRLSNEGVFTSTALNGKINGRYHDSAFFIGDNFIKFGAAVITDGILLSVHPMTDLSSSYVKLKQDYPELNGWQVTNKPALKMPDDRILFIAEDDFGNIAAFIYDLTLDNVTDTGHRLAGATAGFSSYNFKMAWSQLHSAAVYHTDSFGAPARVYLLRI